MPFQYEWSMDFHKVKGETFQELLLTQWSSLSWQANILKLNIWMTEKQKKKR
jgi:hypothetical protein